MFKTFVGLLTKLGFFVAMDFLSRTCKPGYSLTMLHGFNDLIFLFACYCYWDVFVFWKVIFKKLFFKLSCVYLLLEKLINEKYFLVKKNLAWFPGKCFPFILDGKHFLEVVKNLEISYYLLIISNLILKLLIAIYILF
jgi:hypothetical protein